ncbi:MAG: Rnase Y domain-containing protein [Chitinophagaceae bacterium]
MTDILPIIIGAVALIIGILLGKFIFAKNTKKQVEEAEHQSQKIISDAKIQAETLKKERILEAKEQFVQLKADNEKEVFQRNQKLSDAENRLKQKEQSVTQKDQNIAKIIKDNEVLKENLTRQTDVVNNKRIELEKHQEEHIRKLEKVAGLSAEEAKGQLIESLKQEAHSQALIIQQEIVDDAKLRANKEARKLIIQTIQRTAAEQAIENAITVFNLESDEIKGSIIGREGRNIRAIEACYRC